MRAGPCCNTRPDADRCESTSQRPTYRTWRANAVAGRAGPIAGCFALATRNDCSSFTARAPRACSSTVAPFSADATRAALCGRVLRMHSPAGHAVQLSPYVPGGHAAAMGRQQYHGRRQCIDSVSQTCGEHQTALGACHLLQVVPPPTPEVTPAGQLQSVADCARGDEVRPPPHGTIGEPCPSAPGPPGQKEPAVHSAQSKP